MEWRSRSTRARSLRVPEVLRRLDARVLPPIGRVVVRLSRGGRRVHIVRIGAVVLSVAAVLAAVYAAGRSPAPTDGPSGAIVNLGISDGASIPQYVATSNYHLQQLIAESATVARPPQFFALVSFSSYLRPTQLAPVLAGLDVRVTNVIMRVPSKSQTEIIKIDASAIPSDVTRGMINTSTEKAQSVIDYQTLLSKVTGSTPDDLALAQSYRTGAAVSQLEEDSYRDLCGCVYAAVVYATPATLGTLAARPGVRTVEPAPAEQPLDRAVFRPPFPDQHDLSEPPGFSPTASMGPAGG